MVGKYSIDIYDNRVAYHLEVKRNITIIQGNSATGKTELVRMISDYNRGGISSGITLICEKECIALNVLDWKSYLLSAHDKIFFIDENSAFVKTKEFAEIVMTSDNYFVLIYRDSLPQLSYSVEEIYGMRENRESQKYVGVKRTYNELYKLYNLTSSEPFAPDVVVTEDSNSGFDCFNSIFAGRCVSAEGKSNVASKTASISMDGNSVLTIVDGAAFGSDIQQFMRKCSNVLFYKISFMLYYLIIEYNPLIIQYYFFEI